MPASSPIPLLLVDDDGQLRALWSEFLATRGYRVEACRSVAQVEDRLASGLRPAIAIVDWSLPDGDGASVQRALARCCPDTRVVLSSGNEARVTDAAREAAAAVLPKPFRLKELDDLLTRLTSG